MAQIYYALLTKIGQSKVANAIALGKTVRWTSMVVGDGNGSVTNPNEDQTDLVHETYRAQLNQLIIDSENVNYIIAEMVVPTDVGGWYVHEVGIYDDEGDLVVVANFPGTYKPKLSDGSGSDLVIRLLVQVSNASAVTLKIDPAITLASQKWAGDNFVRKASVAAGKTNEVLTKTSDLDGDFAWKTPISLIGNASQTVRGLVQLATAAQALAFKDLYHPITPKTLADAFVGTNAKMAINGYQKLPSGLIIQWGNALSGADGESIITFPVAFPKAMFRAFASEGAAESWKSNVAIVYGTHSATKTGMLVRCKSITGASGPVVAPGVISNWLAIGN